MVFVVTPNKDKRSVEMSGHHHGTGGVHHPMPMVSNTLLPLHVKEMTLSASSNTTSTTSSSSTSNTNNSNNNIDIVDSDQTLIRVEDNISSHQHQHQHQQQHQQQLQHRQQQQQSQQQQQQQQQINQEQQDSSITFSSPPPPSKTLFERLLDHLSASYIFFWIPICINLALIILSWLFPSYVVKSKREKERNRRIEYLHDRMKTAESYPEWTSWAKQLDAMEKKDEWRNVDESPYYDSKLIRFRLTNLRLLAQKGDTHSLIIALRAGLLRNLGGMGNISLFQESRVGTKHVIEEYVEEVVKQLRYVYELAESDDFTLERKFDFFYETRQAFGRTALCLSGGATLGMYHFGVVKALHETRLLPRIISGSSAGSIVASMVGTLTEEEMMMFFKNEHLNLDAFDSGPSYNRKIARLFKKGVLMDIKKLQKCVRENIGDLTFKEAYDKTKVALNITVSSNGSFEFPRLLNYLTAPNVLVWSAACASCALKFLFEPVELMAKDKHGHIIPYHPSGVKFTDGSVEADLPMNRLSELFNVNHFIVSQVNPHVIPFISDKAIKSTNSVVDALKYLGKSEIKHRVVQLTTLGLIPASISGIPSLITQKYSGDITVFPEVTIGDYANIVSNPSPDIMKNCIKKGKQCTWPKVAILKNHCQIELTLDSIVADLRERLNNNYIQSRFHREDLISYSPEPIQPIPTSFKGKEFLEKVI
ncbi:hypothetical protein SAMD00019534_013350, partial [Acytostelium subglobosum LB1]|uniref:hypothetical protein n=1 Tax=Acytostelium subglobosum LB1 TaxID=1410327 RepID=UPI0006449FA9